jgi:ABC-type uncharacterized transport system permease subunit
MVQLFDLIWARVALGCYLGGLAAVITAALLPDPRRQHAAFRLTRAAVAAGFLFQLVSLIEMTSAMPLQPVSFFRLATGLLAFVIAAFFLMVYRAYSPRALSLLVTPLICLLAFAATLAPAASAAGVTPATTALLRNGWIYVHIVLILIGYASLVVAVVSGVLYVIAERGLKGKRVTVVAPPRLPALETLDRVSYRALLVGFPLLTAGLAIGAYWADALFGGISLHDPSVLLALLAWLVYLVLLFARWSAGWRGRRTAYLALICFGLALAGWLANGLSQVHSLFQP